MKVRIDYTIDISVDLRRAIRLYYGRPGHATREEVKEWYQNYGSSMDMDLARSLDFDKEN